MTGAPAKAEIAAPAAPRRRWPIWLSVALGLALFGGANWHLVHVAITSQPDCVAHRRVGDADPAGRAPIAARSACTPEPTGARAP